MMLCCCAQIMLLCFKLARCLCFVMLPPSIHAAQLHHCSLMTAHNDFAGPAHNHRFTWTKNTTARDKTATTMLQLQACPVMPLCPVTRCTNCVIKWYSIAMYPGHSTVYRPGSWQLSAKCNFAAKPIMCLETGNHTASNPWAPWAPILVNKLQVSNLQHQEKYMLLCSAI
jgi:hypothetical protein